MLPWRPGNEFEHLLGRACSTGDVSAGLALLRGADLALPLGDAAAAGTGPPGWPAVRAGGRTWLVAYTSVQAMRDATGGRHCRVASLVELAAAWPDPRWGLAVNPGLAAHLELESGTVARLAVPGLAESRAADPDLPPPVLQKVLTGREVADLLTRGRRRVSGYVHPALDVAGAGTPQELLAALGESPAVLSPYGSMTVLRWAAVGSALYRTPYGGTDEERRAAVAGWVVEEPPFPGLGLGRNPAAVVREYKLDGVGLPAGAELWEVDADGRERPRAVLDPVPDRWWSYRADRDGVTEPVAVEVEGEGGRVVLLTPDGDRRPAAAVAFVTTVGEWRGEPCQVQDEQADELLVEYTGGRAPVGRALGFDRVERGVYRGWVPRAEVRDLREHSVPLDL